jgi:hypothetical protein
VESPAPPYTDPNARLAPPTLGRGAVKGGKVGKWSPRGSTILVVDPRVADRIIDEVVADGVDDWVMSRSVECAVSAAGVDPADRRQAHLEAVRELLDQGLVQIGDVQPRFEAWDVTIDEAIARVEARWDALGRPLEMGDLLYWLSNTPAGDLRGQAVIERDGHGWDG